MLGLIAVSLFWLLTALVFLASVLPLSKIPHGAIRGLAFPRQQWFILAVILVIAAPFAASGMALAWAWGTLALTIVINAIYIAKFTPLWPAQSAGATADEGSDSDRRISLLAANVKQSNRDYARLISVIRAARPDVVMAIETDAEWIDALRQIDDKYPHNVRVPLDTGYGLCLMSRLPLSNSEVREKITTGVPSIRTTITLRSGDDVRLYVVHPEPPLADHDTKGRDSEIAVVGLEAEKDELPVIVSGDLNDVAWSTTTRRFQRLSGLRDPRVGRGFYNTFSAYYPVFRWPLDHLFHDAHFRFLAMRRLPKIGSDHFPMFFLLSLAPDPEHTGQPEDSPEDEREEVEEMIEEEAERERDPIGTDWEENEEKSAN